MALSIPTVDPQEVNVTLPAPYSRVGTLHIDLIGKTMTFEVWTWRSLAAYNANRPPLKTESYTIYPAASKTADGDDVTSFVAHVAANQNIYNGLQAYLYGLLKSFKKWQGANDV